MAMELKRKRVEGMPEILRKKTLTDREAVQYLSRRVSLEHEQRDRRQWEDLWWSNLLYMGGNAYHVRQPGQFPRPMQRKVRGKDYHQANLILPKVMRALAKLIGVQGQFHALPQSPHREDVQAAKLAGRVFDHLRSVVKFPKLQRRVMLQAAIFGSSFIKTSWDPKAGKQDRVFLREDEDIPDIMPEFLPELQADRIRKGRVRMSWPGEVRSEVVDPPLIYWDPRALGGGIDACRYIVQVDAIPVEDAYNMYGIDVAPDSIATQSAERFRQMFAHLASSIFPEPIFGQVLDEERMGLVRRAEMFERPTDSNRGNGRYMLMVGDQMVRQGDNEYARTGSPIPFVKFDWFPAEMRFMGYGLVEQARHPQKAYNDSRTHEQGFAKNHGFGATFLPRNAGVKPTQIVAMHGAVYEYNASVGPPIFGQAPNMPPYLAQLPDRARAEIDLIAAQTDPTNNRLPGQLRSGTAIAAVQADNNLILTPTSDSMLEGTAEVGTQMLQLASVYYDEPRIMVFRGKDGSIDPRRFIGADLRGHTEILVVAAPGALLSPEARRAELMDAVQLGAIDLTNPGERALFFRAMHFETGDEVVNKILQQVTAEEREIDRMVEEPEYFSEPAPYMDPQIRAEVLELYLNSNEFEALDDLTQKKVFTRWQLFSQMIQARVQAALQAQALTAGTPGEKGEASQPRQAR